MPVTPTTPTRITRALMSLPLLVALSAVLLGVSPASAHDEFEGSDPADGSTLTSTPAQVVLTFAEAPLEAGLGVVATGPDGVHHDLAPTVDGATVVAPWPGTLDQGTYIVAYRVVADDGHPVSGKISFTIGATTPSGPSSASPVATSTADQPATADTRSNQFPYWALALGIAALIGVLGALRYRSTRNRT